MNPAIVELDSKLAAANERIRKLESALAESDEAASECVRQLREADAELTAEREVSDKLVAALQRIFYFQQDIGHPPLLSVAESMRTNARAALAEVAAIRKQNDHQT